MVVPMIRQFLFAMLSVALLVSTAPGASAAFSVNSVNGVPRCSLLDIVNWASCLETFVKNLNTTAFSSQADWDSADSVNKTLIEAGYYCNTAKNLVNLAAQCIPVCTNDNVDYFGRAQLKDFCQSTLNKAGFATQADFDNAQVTYNCSQPPVTCDSVITAQLQNTLLTYSAASSARVNPSIMLGAVLVMTALFFGF